MLKETEYTIPVGNLLIDEDGHLNIKIKHFDYPSDDTKYPYYYLMLSDKDKVKKGYMYPVTPNFEANCIDTGISILDAFNSSKVESIERQYYDKKV